MGKKGRWITGGALLITAVLVISFFVEFPVLLINGTPIYSQEYQIHGAVAERVARSRAIMDWASELEGEKSVSYGEILQALERENAERKAKKESDQPIYGPLEFDHIQYYKKYVGDCQQRIVQKLEQEAEQDALVQFYDRNRQQYRHADTISAEYSVWQQGVLIREGTVQLDRYNIRSMSESNEQLVENLLQLSPQQELFWDASDGIQIQLRCTQRIPGEVAPYEEVAGAVLQQYAAQQFEDRLEERIKESRIWVLNGIVGGNA